MAEDEQYVRFIEKLRGMNSAVRWNQHPHIKSENIAAHSFHVAIFALVLGKMAGFTDEATHYSVTCAVMHDVEESITTDLPAPIKRRVADGWAQLVTIAVAELFLDAEPLKKYAMDGDTPIIKLADSFAALMYCDNEMNMGNILFKDIRAEIIWRIYDKAEKMANPLGQAALTLITGLGFTKNMGIPETASTISHL